MPWRTLSGDSATKSLLRTQRTYGNVKARVSCRGYLYICGCERVHVRVFVNSVEGYESVKNYASQVFCGTAGIGGHASRTMGQSEQRIRLVSLSVSVSVSKHPSETSCFAVCRYRPRWKTVFREIKTSQLRLRHAPTQHVIAFSLGATIDSRASGPKLGPRPCHDCSTMF